MPKVFVIMPFTSEFDDIFNLFLAETLSGCGYEVFRADDINNSQNILSDIVQSIANSDLIVADLTGANPNVYYELGIAHALKRPVIMLTQDIEDLPFDLRSYRAIPYSTDFVKIREAKKQLSSLAIDALHGKVVFGNPVIDFSINVSPIVSSSKDDDSHSGILDFLAEMEISMEDLTSILMSIAEATNLIAEKTTSATEKFSKLSGSAKDRRLEVRNYAFELENYSQSLKQLNNSYSSSLFSYESSVSHLFGEKSILSTQEDFDGLNSLLIILKGTECSVQTFIDQNKTLLIAIEESPNIERNFIRAKNATVRELKCLIQNSEKTLSVLSHSRAMGNILLESFELQAEHQQITG